MSWKKHPRHLTDEQFSDSTTIDGNRLDTAMSDIVRRFNAVEKGDIASRFVQTQFVAGWSPQDAAATSHRWPWMDAMNTKGASSVAGAAPDSVNNRFRTKGYYTLGMNSSMNIGTTWEWSTSYYFHKPAILTDLVLTLQIDHPTASGRGYTNDFKYGSAPPEGVVQYDGNKDLALVVSADSPFAPEDRTQNNVLLSRVGFDTAREWVNGIAFNGSITDMSPTNPPWAAASRGGLWGMCLPLRDINVPIPRDTRIRIDVVIPRYDDANTGGWGDTNPWAQQRFDMTMTVLEELES